jgi:hypothetical protein
MTFRILNYMFVSFLFVFGLFLCRSTYQKDRNNAASDVKLPANEQLQVSALNAFFYVSVVANPLDTSKLDALKHYHIIYLPISYSTQSIAIIGVTKNSTNPNMITFAFLDKVLMSSKPSISLVTV